MPFTFSHPALVLPLKYLPANWFSFTGLIIGSMVPDFEYFIRMRIYSIYSHTLPGLLWFDLPLGLLLGFAFHNIVKTRFIDNLPYVLKVRFDKLKHFNWNKYFIANWHVVIISILVGAASHLLWDNFTHTNGFFVQQIPSLSNETAFFDRRVPLSNLIQHLSSLLGGLIIAIAIWQLRPSEIAQVKVNSKYWMLLTLIILVIVGLRFITGLSIREYGNVIVTIIAAVLISLLITPFLVKKSNL